MRRSINTRLAPISFQNRLTFFIINLRLNIQIIRHYGCASFIQQTKSSIVRDLKNAIARLGRV